MPPQRWEGANFTASAPGAENPIYATASLAELCRGKLDTLLDNRMLRDARPQQQQQPPQWWWGGVGCLEAVKWNGCCCELHQASARLFHL